MTPVFHLISRDVESCQQIDYQPRSARMVLHIRYVLFANRLLLQIRQSQSTRWYPLQISDLDILDTTIYNPPNLQWAWLRNLNANHLTNQSTEMLKIESVTVQKAAHG